MKVDRFVKIMLVVIAGLLLLNCVKDLPILNSNSNSATSTNSTATPFLETSAKASVMPAFIEKGKVYNFLYSQYGQSGFPDIERGKVLEIDKDSGWLYIEFYDPNTNKSTGRAKWTNIDHVRGCWEEKIPL